MIRIRKYTLVFLLSLILLMIFGGKGYDCVSDDVSFDKIESNERLKLISGVISILGEGTSFHKKSASDVQKDFWGTYARSFCPDFVSCMLPGERFFSSVSKAPFVSKSGIYISISALRI